MSRRLCVCQLLELLYLTHSFFLLNFSLTPSLKESNLFLLSCREKEVRSKPAAEVAGALRPEWEWEKGLQQPQNRGPVQTWQSWAVREVQILETSQGNSNFGFLNWKTPYGDPGSCSGSDTSCVTVSMGAFRSQVPRAQNEPHDSVPTSELTRLTLCQSVGHRTRTSVPLQRMPGPHMQVWGNRPSLEVCLGTVLQWYFKPSLTVLVFRFYPLFFPLAQNVTVVNDYGSAWDLTLIKGLKSPVSVSNFTSQDRLNPCNFLPFEDTGPQSPQKDL